MSGVPRSRGAGVTGPGHDDLLPQTVVAIEHRPARRPATAAGWRGLARRPAHEQRVAARSLGGRCGYIVISIG